MCVPEFSFIQYFWELVSACHYLLLAFIYLGGGGLWDVRWGGCLNQNLDGVHASTISPPKSSPCNGEIAGLHFLGTSAPFQENVSAKDKMWQLPPKNGRSEIIGIYENMT